MKIGRVVCLGVIISSSVLLGTGCGSDSGGAASEVELDSRGLPLEDVECEVREADGEVRTYAYQAATRTLTTDKLRITFDEAGRYVSRGDPSGEWLHEYTYDEHGEITKFVYSWQGSVSAENSSTYQLEYGDDGLLSERITQSDDGLSASTSVFSYDVGRLVRIVTTGEYAGTATDSETVYRYDAQGRVHEVEQGVEIRQYEYDEAGRLTDAIQDGFRWGAEAPDGKPEIAHRWHYTPSGTLYRYTVDGTTELDNPVVDGELDIDRRFSPDCTALLVLGRDEIFHLPPSPIGD
jgi:YD repeat-containing protein